MIEGYAMMHGILMFFGFIRNSKLHELWAVLRYFPVKWSWSLTSLSCGWNTLLHIWHFVALSKSRCCCTVSFFIGNFFLRKCLTSLATTITWSKNSSATFSPRRTTGFRKKRWSLDLTYRAALHGVCNCLFSVHEKSSFSLFANPFWVLWLSKILSKSAYIMKGTRNWCSIFVNLT